MTNDAPMEWQVKIARAEVIYPISAPQCEANREHRTALETPDSPLKPCKHTARYKIDGCAMCAKHAQVAALQILLMPENLEQVTRRFSDVAGFIRERQNRDTPPTDMKGQDDGI